MGAAPRLEAQDPLEVLREKIRRAVLRADHPLTISEVTREAQCYAHEVWEQLPCIDGVDVRWTNNNRPRLVPMEDEE